MAPDEHTMYKKALDDFQERANKMTKQEARDYLFKLGMINRDGTLHKNYGGVT